MIQSNIDNDRTLDVLSSLPRKPLDTLSCWERDRPSALSGDMKFRFVDVTWLTSVCREMERGLSGGEEAALCQAALCMSGGINRGAKTITRDGSRPELEDGTEVRWEEVTRGLDSPMRDWRMRKRKPA
jgi:hypothetical protein